MKRLLVSIAVLPIFAALAWVGGYNFDERNIFVAYLCLVAIMVAGVVYFAPHWDD